MLAIVGAVALSPLAPVGPVRQVDPARRFQFDTTVLLGGAAVLTLLLLSTLAWLSWRAVGANTALPLRGSTFLGRRAPQLGLPITAELGAGYALAATPGSGRSVARANLIGSIVAVGAVVTAAVFAASLNGLVTHPDRYGWNWGVLVENQGGYGGFLPSQVTPATLGNGDGGLDHVMSTIPGIEGWSTFGFTQLPIDGQVIPVLGLATHHGAVQPPTIDGQSLNDTQPQDILASPRLAPGQIELGVLTLQQLGRSVGDSVRAGTGPTAQTLKIVGTVTLPSIGVMLSDHVSLGRGAMLAESTLLNVLDLRSVAREQNPEAISALPSTLALDLKPGTSESSVVDRLRAFAVTQGGAGDLYRTAARARRADRQRQPDGIAAGRARHCVGRGHAPLSHGDGAGGGARRRRELALMKALGLTRSQLRNIVTVQTLTLLFIAVVVGLPVGIATGHLLWINFAGSLGVVPVVVIPLVALVIGVIALFVAGTALGTVPAGLAARTPTTLVLRSE